MTGAKKCVGNPERFLLAAGITYRMIDMRPGQVFFSQGGLADTIFFIEAGRAKLTVVSEMGKEATVSTLMPGDFIGEESLTGVAGLHDATATAITPCRAIKVGRKELLLLLHEDQDFSDMFLKFVLLRGARTREDLIDQLFNNSEKRLARTLLIMAEFGKHGEAKVMIPAITQEELAEIIGTTRSRVSKFMNGFRRHGYITYDSRIHVHKSLLSVVLHDRFPRQRATRPVLRPGEHGPQVRRTKEKVHTKAAFFERGDAS